VPLAAIVVGAGAASTLAAIAEPIAGVLLASAAVLGIAIYARRRARAAAAVLATDGGCGCGPRETRTLYSSPEPAVGAPVACTIDLGNKRMVQSGIDEYRRLFVHLEATERTKDGFRWRFRNAPGLQARLERLARAEHACCSFMKFDVSSTGEEIVWEVRADAGAQSVVDEYMRMPERLREETRPGHDVAHVKTGVSRAGIAFTADSTR
jgi:predicted secreted protein